jgi:hypothetical protein
VKLLYNQGSAAVWGAKSADTSGQGTFSAESEYCPPGDTDSCTPPVGEWKFDEKTGTNANDTSGNGNTGSFSNDPQWKHAGECKHGACLEFDGSNDYISITDNGTDMDLTTGGAITATAWIKFNTSENDNGIIGKSSETNKSWFLGEDNGTAGKIECCEYNTTLCATSDNVLNDDLWHHVVCSIDDGSANEMALWVDGQKQSDTEIITPPGPGGDNSEPVLIGYVPSQSRDYWNGLIDNVRVYNYARTPAQIAWEYNRGAPVGHWKFDEGEGNSTSTVYDSSGNENNGTISLWGGGNTATSSARVSGKLNDAIDFDGGDDFISIPDPELPTSDFAYSLWFKQDNSGNETIIIGPTSTGANEFSIQVSSTRVIDVYVNTTLTINNSGTAMYEYGEWTHLVVTRSGSDVTLYVNGLKHSQGTEGGTLNFSTCPLLIGVDADSGTCDSNLNDYFDGTIDDSRVYNYALTETQIKTLYNSGAVRFGP